MSTISGSEQHSTNVGPMQVSPRMIETSHGKVECACFGEGPAVLVLHGAMGGYDQGVLLGRAAVGLTRFRFIAPSRPGYLATRLDVGRTPEEQADACADVLDAIGVPTAAVIAISGGGQCALQFALRHTGRCGALVMISACSAQLHVNVPFRFRILKLMARVPAIEERLRKKALQDPAQAARRSIPDPQLRTRTLNDPEAGPLMAALQLSTMDRMKQRLPGTENDIVQSRLPYAYPLEQISAPVLVIHGAEDEAVPADVAKSLAARVANSELMLIDGGRHTSLFTHLHEIRTHVVPFLDAYAGLLRAR